MSKSGREFVMLVGKAKNTEGKGGSTKFFRHPLGDFRHPLKITLPPPGRNPETASDYNILYENKKVCVQVLYFCV